MYTHHPQSNQSANLSADKTWLRYVLTHNTLYLAQAHASLSTARVGRFWQHSQNIHLLELEVERRLELSGGDGNDLQLALVQMKAKHAAERVDKPTRTTLGCSPSSLLHRPPIIMSRM